MERLTEIRGKQIYYKDNKHNELRTPNEMSQDDMYDILNKLASFEDKEEPKKVIKIDGVSSQACPVCKSNVNWNYCSNCGQRIKY